MAEKRKKKFDQEVIQNKRHSFNQAGGRWTNVDSIAVSLFTNSEILHPLALWVAAVSLFVNNETAMLSMQEVGQTWQYVGEKRQYSVI